jgi:hypothetical protein
VILGALTGHVKEGERLTRVVSAKVSAAEYHRYRQLALMLCEYRVLQEPTISSLVRFILSELAKSQDSALRAFMQKQKPVPSYHTASNHRAGNIPT